MPYSSVDEVPSNVPKSKRKKWMAVWNAIWEEHHDEGRAFAGANAAIKKVNDFLLNRLTKSNTKPYPDTGEYDSDLEDEIRSEIEIWADYAEEGVTYDPDGKYLCGSCSYRSGTDDCLPVVSPINFETGSCRIYEHGEPSGQLELPVKLTQLEVVYTERPTVKGFGCSRCMYGGKAKVADAEGRPGWCSFWGCHVWPKACCFKNTGDDDIIAPVKAEKMRRNVKTTLEKTSSKTLYTIETI